MINANSLPGFIAVITASAMISTHVSAQTVVVASSGQTVPDGDGSYSSFGRPMLNDAGEAAFTALLTGTDGGSADDSGIFLGSGGAVTQIVREGDPAPDGNGNFAVLFNPAVNDVSQVAFKSSLSGTNGGSTDNEGIFLGGGGAPTQLARKGGPTPITDVTYTLLFDPALNNAGQAAFEANLTGTGVSSANDTGMFRVSTAGDVTIVREGDLAPDGNGNYTFLSNVSMNESGQVAFESSLTGTPDTAGVFVGSGGAVTQIARRNDPSPDSNGVFTASLGDGVINDSGQVAFDAALTATSGGSADDRGLYRGAGGVLTQIAREGQASPDSNGLLRSFSSYVISNNGQVAFSATLSSTNGGTSDDRGLYKGDGSTLTLMAREGQVVPNGSGTFSSFSDVAINNTGQVAFRTTLSGTVNPSAIFFYDDTLGLLQVARSGDPLLGSTISNITFFHNNYQGDESNGFNNAGQVAYGFSLSNGVTGIAVWSSPLVGDLDSDGFVGITDLNIILGAWNQNVPPGDPLADPSGDGFVGIEDLNLILGNWNAGTPPAQNTHIPEPAGLTGLWLLALLHGRTRP